MCKSSYNRNIGESGGLTLKTEINEVKKGFTHGGIFHADDVFATALLKILNPDIEITRGNQIPENFEGIIYDIGGGEFDHHQKDKRIRENGVPYAAFGLLWEKYGEEILGKKEAEKFEVNFVQQIDWADNTGEYNILARVISDRNTTWKESHKDTKEEFEKAVEFAKEILENSFRQVWAKQDAYKIVREKAENCKDGILCLEQAMPWKEAVKGLEIVYVIFVSQRGGYCIQAVPSEEEDSERALKKPFPECWRGATKEELQSMTGVKTFNFCHNGGFLSAVDTLEDAIKVAELAINMN